MERNGNVLPMHEDVDQGFATGEAHVVLARADHVPDRRDHLIGRHRGGAPAGGVVDHPIHAAERAADDHCDRRREADLLQGQVRDHVAHRPALAERRLPPFVLTDLLGVPDINSAAFARYGATIGSGLSGPQSLATWLG
jgi:hypothetical protein